MLTLEHVAVFDLFDRCCRGRGKKWTASRAHRGPMKRNDAFASSKTGMIAGPFLQKRWMAVGKFVYGSEAPGSSSTEAIEFQRIPSVAWYVLTSSRPPIRANFAPLSVSGPVLPSRSSQTRPNWIGYCPQQFLNGRWGRVSPWSLLWASSTIVRSASLCSLLASHEEWRRRRDGVHQDCSRTGVRFQQGQRQARQAVQQAGSARCVMENPGESVTGGENATETARTMRAEATWILARSTSSRDCKTDLDTCADPTLDL